jgi:hypothetical protein
MIGSSILVILVLVILSSCTRKKPILEKDLGFTIKPLEEGEVINAVSLWNAYQANKEASDRAYKDKIIRVKGKVRFLSPRRKKNKDTCYIILEKDTSSRSFISGVQCQFKGNINDIAPDLKIGDEITIRGTCVGKVVNVFLENCAIGDNPIPSEKPIDPLMTIKPPKIGEIIDAVGLWGDYQKGILKADAVYNKKVLLVKGNILSFGPPRFWRGNTSFIILEADLLSHSPLRGIQCEFKGNILKDFPNLKKGDEIVVEGICSSKLVNVFLKNCRIVK